MKDINTGGNGLTNINSASLGSQAKFIDTMKYYFSSLGSLASTLDNLEKMRVKKLTLQFLNQYDYFSKTWLLLDFNQKRNVLGITVSGKGVIPCMKIVSIDSLNIKLKNGFFFFFTKDEFCSTQKGKAVDEEEYNNSKLLYTLQKCKTCPIEQSIQCSRHDPFVLNYQKQVSNNF